MEVGVKVEAGSVRTLLSNFIDSPFPTNTEPGAAPTSRPAAVSMSLPAACTSLLVATSASIPVALSTSLAVPGALSTSLAVPGALSTSLASPSLQTGHKASLINQIATQLANSKASQSMITPPNVSIAPAPFSNGIEMSKNPIVATMTEALSLKQSPTLTKQLSKPASGSTSGVQVITQYMCRYCGQQFESTNDMQLHIQVNTCT